MRYINFRDKMVQQDARFFFRKRYWVALMVFLGWAVLFILRMNLSISIVKMTSNETITRGNVTYIEVSLAPTPRNPTFGKNIQIFEFTFRMQNSIGIWLKKA